MGNFLSSILAESQMIPAANNAFWSVLGNAFVKFGAMIRDALFNLLYVICKFALNVIDFMQLLVQKLAGVEVWLHLDKLDVNNLSDADVVFRFLFSDTVQRVFRAVIVLFLVLLIVFSIVAIIKNEYDAATSGKAVDHKQTWFNAFKSIVTVVLVPLLLIGGIITSNAILAGLMKAFNVNSSLSLGGQIFVASAYDASDYRQYATVGTRQPVSNLVTYTNHNKKTVRVSSAITVTMPEDYTGFTGYVFTFNGDDYFLWYCKPEDEGINLATGGFAEGNTAAGKNYYYLKYVLGAYVVEAKPRHDADETAFEYYKEHYSNNLVDKVSAANKAQNMYRSSFYGWNMKEDAGLHSLLSVSGLTSGGLSRDDIYNLMVGRGFVCGYNMDNLSDPAGTLLRAARNTWSYNNMLQDGVAGWGENGQTVEITQGVLFETALGNTKNAMTVQNSKEWAAYHDGGRDGYHPLPVEYEVMADVFDFAISNNVKLYFVNSNNSSIVTYYSGGNGTFDRNTLYVGRKTGTDTIAEEGYLVDYKNYGRVAYKKSTVAQQSEIEGANYIVCYYDDQTGTYIPLTNGIKMYDSFGNSYTFKSSKLADSYHGVVIARGLFEKVNEWVSYRPTYIAQTMVLSNTGVHTTDDKTLVSAKLLNMGYYYNYLEQLSFQDKDSTSMAEQIVAGSGSFDGSKFVYYAEHHESGMTKADLINSIVGKIAYFDLYGENSYEIVGISSDEPTSAAEVGDQYIIYLKHDTESQRYDLKVTLSDLSDVVGCTGGEESVEFAELDRYVLNMNSFSAFGYTGQPTYSQLSRATVVGYDDFKVSYSAETVKMTIVAPTQEQAEVSEDNKYAVVQGFMQVLGNRYYAKDIQAISGATPYYQFDIYERATAEGTDYVDGAKLYRVKLSRSAIDVVDEEYLTSFSIDLSSEELHEDELIPFDDQTADLPEFSEENIGTTTINPAAAGYHNMIYYYNNQIHYYSDNEKFDTVAHAYNSTIKIVRMLREMVYAEGYTLDDIIIDAHGNESSRSEQSISLIKADITEYASSFVATLKKDDDVSFRVRINLSLANLIDTGKTVDDKDPSDPEAKEVYERVINVSFEILNTFTIHSSSSKEYGEGQPIYDNLDNLPIVSLADFEYVGRKQYGMYWVNQYSFVDEYSDVKEKKTLVFNAVANGDSKVDGGVIFVGYHKEDDEYVLNDLKGGISEETAKTMFYQLSAVRVAQNADYIFSIYREDEHATHYYVIDLTNTTIKSVFLYDLTLADGANSTDNFVVADISRYSLNNGTYALDEAFATAYTKAGDDDLIDYAANPAYINGQGGSSVINVAVDQLNNPTLQIKKSELKERALEYAKSHFDIKIQYIYTRDFENYELASDSYSTSKLYKVALTSIVGNNYVLYANNVEVPGIDTSEKIERQFETYMTTMLENGVQYKKSDTQDKDTEIGKYFAELMNNPVTIIFCRDKMSTTWLGFDFRFKLTWEGLWFNLIFRLHIGSTIIQENPNLTYINEMKSATEVVKAEIINHTEVVSLRRGTLAIDYNFAGAVAVDNVYLVYAINWIVLIFAIVIVFGILGKAVWGLILRIYQITLLFLVMPAVASAIPLDNSKRFGTWRDNIIKEVLGAYGVCIGLNFFFIIMPVIRDASAIFTDADVQALSSGLKFIVHDAARLNLLVYLMFLLVALTMLKKVPELIAQWIGASNVVAQGAQVKKDVASTVSEAGSAISGASALKAIDSAKATAKGMIPGGALVEAGKKKYGEYKKKKADKEKAVEERRNEYNKNAQDQDINSSLDSILNPPAPPAGGADGAMAEQGAQANEAQNDATYTTEAAQQPAEFNAAGVSEQISSTIDDAAASAEAGAGEDYTTDMSQDADSNMEAANFDMSGSTVDADAMQNYQAPELAGEQKADEAVSEDKEQQSNASGEGVDPVARQMAQQALDQNKTIAGATKQVQDMQMGRTHDYYGDKLKTEAEQQEYEKSKTGKAEAKYNKAQEKVNEQIEKAQEGNGARSHITQKDIEEYNKNHRNDKDFVEMKKKGEAGYNSKEQKNLRIRLAQMKHIEQLQDKAEKQKDIFEDAKHGIYRGVGGSFVRTFLSGEKTTEQRKKESEKYDKAQKRKNVAEAAAQALEENKDAKFDELSKNPQLKATANKIKEEFIAKEVAKSKGKLSSKQAEKTFNNLSEAQKISMLENAVNKELVSSTKAFNKAEAKLADDRKGLGHATVGRFVRFAASKNEQLKEYMKGENRFARAGQKKNNKRDSAIDEYIEQHKKLTVIRGNFDKSKENLDAVKKSIETGNDRIDKINNVLKQSKDGKLTAVQRKQIGQEIEAGIKDGSLKGTFVADVYAANIKKGTGKGTKSGMQNVISALIEEGKKEKSKYATFKDNKLLLNRISLADNEQYKKANKAFKIAERKYNQQAKVVVSARKNVINKTAKAKLHGMEDGVEKDVYTAQVKGKTAKAKNIKQKALKQQVKEFEKSIEQAEKDEAKAKKDAEKRRIRNLKNVSGGKSVAAAQTAASDAANEKLAKNIAKATKGKVEKDAQKIAEKQYNKTLNEIRKSLDAPIRAEIDKAIKNAGKIGSYNGGAGRRGGSGGYLDLRTRQQIEKEIRKQLEKRLTELNLKAQTGGVTAGLNAEINKLRSQLSRLNNANATYNRRIRQLVEADKKMSRKLKNQSNASSLEKQMNHKNAFSGDSN